MLKPPFLSDEKSMFYGSPINQPAALVAAQL